MGLPETAEPRHQPARGEGRQRRHGQRPRGPLGEQIPGGIVDEGKGAAQGRQIGLAVIGEQQRPVEATEQLTAQVLLQGLHLVAHRRLGDEQLLRGPGEAQVPRGGLEGPQGVQRRQATSHGINPQKI